MTVCSPSENLRASFVMSHENCQALAQGLGTAMDEGLAGRPSDLRMLPSFVVCMPDGQEEGTYYALDLVSFVLIIFMCVCVFPVIALRAWQGGGLLVLKMGGVCEPSGKTKVYGGRKEGNVMHFIVF